MTRSPAGKTSGGLLQHRSGRGWSHRWRGLARASGCPGARSPGRRKPLHHHGGLELADATGDRRGPLQSPATRRRWPALPDQARRPASGTKGPVHRACDKPVGPVRRSEALSCAIGNCDTQAHAFSRNLGHEPFRPAILVPLRRGRGLGDGPTPDSPVAHRRLTLRCQAESRCPRSRRVSPCPRCSRTRGRHRLR